VRLQPVEQRLLKGCCILTSAIGCAWMLAVPIWIVGKAGLAERALLGGWFVAFLALTAASIVLFRAISRPIVEIAAAFRHLLLVVFALRFFESIIYLVNGGAVFGV